MAKLNIRIDDKFTLTSDTHNFIVNEHWTPAEGKLKGKEQLRAIGFYPTLAQAVSSLLNHKMRDSTAQSLKALRTEQSAFTAHVRALLEGE